MKKGTWDKLEKVSLYLAIMSIALLMLYFATHPSEAYPAEKETKYTVEVELRFNELDSAATADLIEELTKHYSEACSLKISVKKAASDSDVIIWNDGSSNFTLTPGSIPDGQLDSINSHDKDCTEGEDCK